MHLYKFKSTKLLIHLLLLVFLLGISNAVLASIGASVTLVSGDPYSISPGETTRLEITLSNSNTTSDVNDVTFNNSLPGTLTDGLKVSGAYTYTCYDPATPSTSPGAGTFTAVAGTQAIGLVNGIIPKRDPSSSTDGSCTIVIPVTAGTSTGAQATYSYTIDDGAVTGNDGSDIANVGDVSQSINVLGMAQPVITKSFSNGVAILGGAARTLTITITNTASAAIPNFSITDTFPAQGAGGSIIQVVDPASATSSCNHSGTAPVFSPALADGQTAISVINGTVAPQTGGVNGTCTITVEVEARHTNDNYQTSDLSNTINAISDFSNDLGIQAQADAKANIRARSPLNVNKSFSPDTLADGQVGTMTINLINNGATALTVDSFTDSPIDGVGDPTVGIGLKVNEPISVSCQTGGTAGTYTATTDDLGIIQTTPSTIAAGRRCTITTPFIGYTTDPHTPISYTNTIAKGDVDVGDPAIVSPRRTASILVADTLRVLKTHNTPDPRPGNPVQYGITVQNWSAADMSNVEIEDVLENGMTFLTGPINGLDYTPSLSGSGCLGLIVSNVTGDANANFVIGNVPQRTNISTPGACIVTFYAMTAEIAADGSSTENNLAVGSVCTSVSGTRICNGVGAGSGNEAIVAAVWEIDKSFAPSGPLNEGTVSRMTIRLDNYSANPITSITLSDTLPIAVSGGQMQIANPANAATTCGGSISALTGDTSITLNGGTISGRADQGTGAAGSCNLQVDVVGPAGLYDNTASAAGTQTYANGSPQLVGPISDDASLTYNSILSATKDFTPPSVSSGGLSTVTLRMSNSGSVSLNNVSVTDPLPTGMTIASPANAYTTCSGNASITATPGANSISMSSANIPGSGDCAMLFDVIATGSANWVNSIPTGGILAADTGVTNQSPVSATLNYNAGSNLTIAKVTNPSTLTFPGQVSRLTIGIANGNQAVTNLKLTDYFTVDGTPGAGYNGMIIASDPAVTTSCPGAVVNAIAFGERVSLDGASLAPSQTCTFSVNVTSIVVGGITNFIPAGAIVTNQGLTNSGQATTSLTTQGNLGVVKEFIPGTLKPGTRGRLRLTFYNAQQLAVTGLAVIDTLPAGLTIPAGPGTFTTCTDAIVNSPASNQMQISNGVLEGASGAMAASCYAEIDIIAATQGDYSNTIAAGDLTAISGTTSISNSQPTSAILRAKTKLSLTKAFSLKTLDAGDPAGFTTGSDTKLPGQSAEITIVLENTNDQALTRAAFIDTLPTDLFIAPTPNASTSCVDGVVTATPSGTSVRLTGATIPANGSCNVKVTVLSNVPGNYINTIPAGEVTTFEGVTNEDSTSAQLIVAKSPAVSKEFSPAVIPSAGVSTLIISLENGNSAELTLTSALIDTLPTAPGAMTIASTPGVVKSCPGNVTATPGSNSITYANGAKVPAGGCTIQVNVTAAVVGTYNNSIPVAGLETDLGSNQEPANAALMVSNLGYISGRVFKDNNLLPDGNYQDGQDIPISGETIELRSGSDCSGTFLASITTDARGNYLFANLTAGSYSVCQPVQPSDTTNGMTTAGIITQNNGSTGTIGSASNPTTSTSQIINIFLDNDGGSGEVSGSPDNNFAEIAESNISGTVFFDDNNNGVQNGVDIGIDNVTINLTGYTYGANGIDDGGAGDDLPVNQSTATDGNGDYAFNNLLPGRYTIIEPIQPPGSSNGITTAGVVPNGGTPGNITGVTTLPSIIGDTTRLVLPPNTDSYDNNFAEIANNRTLSGQIFLDYNDDGILNGIDHGVGNETVNVNGTDINGNAVSQTTLTAADGSYSFNGLPEGTYQVTQPVQPVATTNGKTNCITAGCLPTDQGTTPSSISSIDLTGATMVSPNNDFAEIPSAAPNLIISKNHTPEIFVENNDSGLYIITPENIGTVATFETVIITDILPVGISVVGTPVGTGWNCNAAGQTVTCNSTDVIAAGSSGNPIMITVSIASGLSGQVITNTAEISSTSEPDSFSGNNSTSDTASVAIFDFADAPDTSVGTGPKNYFTVATNNGAAHILGIINAPYLGACVDGDNGSLQNPLANSDDTTTATITIGSCATDGDDEDGVIFNTQLIVGRPASIDVTASSGTNDCVLNGWIDYNGDGDFTDVDEQIVVDQTIAAGATASINFTVPASAAFGVGYSRFRCSSTAGLLPTGPASDGEVEDYAVFFQPDPIIVLVDFGDAPDSYATLLASDGARHVIGGALLGTLVDAEADGQPGVNADNDIPDEEGVVIPAIMYAGELVSLPVTASGSCLLDAWIDYNADGDWNDAGEQISTSQALSTGVNNISFTVPATAVNGATYARFRCSSAGGLTPSGVALDGEVEDYRLMIQALPVENIDYGDNPDTSAATGTGNYLTIRDHNGPSHALGVLNAPYLGACVDGDNGSLQNPLANSDDTTTSTITIGNCATDGDDEDGVIFNTQLIVGRPANIDVTASSGTNDCVLNGWIDYNGDGDFTDVDEQIVIDQTITSGTTSLFNFSVPATAATGNNHARFRCASLAGLLPTGPAQDGEIEDYLIYIESDPATTAIDYGDAPDITPGNGKDDYSTTQESNGAAHILGVPNAPYLGTCVDSDNGKLQNLQADMDDVTPASSSAPNIEVGDCSKGNDEDGVYFRTPLIQGQSANIHITVSEATNNCSLDAWIDFNADGDFLDALEQVANGMSITSGTTEILAVNVPAGAIKGSTIARFRCSSSGGLAATGMAPDGEVEDYLVTILAETDSAIEVTAVAVCINDTSFIEYQVLPIGFTPDNLATIEWRKMDGTLISELFEQKLTGQLIWPGTILDASGAALSWPGWELVDGVWVPVDDGLRPDLIMNFQVNPTTGVVVNYPPVTPQCNADEPKASDPPIDIPTLNNYSLILLILSMFAVMNYYWFYRRIRSGQ